MSDAAKAFRDYATRISFNLSLSRNQVGHLAAIVMEVENEELRAKVTFDTRAEQSHKMVAETGGRPNLFIVGRGSLERMGLVTPDPRWLAAGKSPEKGAVWKYHGPCYQLTPAGAHVVELLRIAGLIPMAAVTRTRKRRAA